MDLNHSIDFELLYGLVLLCIIVIFKWKDLKKNTKIDKFIIFTYYIYIIGVISVTFFPINLFLINNKPSIDFRFSDFINYIPFKTISSAIDRHLYIQVLGNLLLLFPLGIYYSLVKKQQLGSFRGFIKIFTVGFTLSLFIETVQLIISLTLGVPERIFDVDDLLLNTLGMLIGYLFFRLYLYLFKKFRLNSELLEAQISFREGSLAKE